MRPRSAGRSHRTKIAIDLGDITLSSRDGFQIRACTKGAISACQNGDGLGVIGLEFRERIVQRLSRVTVDSIAGMRAINGDDCDVIASFGQDGLGHSGPLNHTLLRHQPPEGHGEVAIVGNAGLLIWTKLDQGVRARQSDRALACMGGAHHI